MSQFTLSTIITATYLVSFGQALLDCRNPRTENEAFLDLEELQSLTATYPDVFQSPAKCSTEINSDCANQICCKDEIGCCYVDMESKRQLCGCKAKTDKECTRGPPLVYIRTYHCEDHHSVESNTCIRKTNDVEIVDGSVATWFGVISRNDVDDSLKATGETVGKVVQGVKKTTSDEIAANEVFARRLVDGLPVNKLLRMISTDKLNIIVEEVIARRMKGLPYGHEQMH